jgi:hypothetical protein
MSAERIDQANLKKRMSRIFIHFRSHQGLMSRTSRWWFPVTHKEYNKSHHTSPRELAMAHSHRKAINGRVIRIGLTVISGLLFFSSWPGPAQAQLSRCSSLQQQQLSSRCERPGISSGSSLETIPGFPGSTGSAIGAGGITGLPDLAKPRPHYAPLDSIVEPMLPRDSVRDYLNRQDPAHAIQPIQPLPPMAPLTGGNR